MKIGFLSYAHLGINTMMPGGGGVVNELIKQVLEEAGHQVDFIKYSVKGVQIPGLPGLAKKLNRLAMLHGWRNAASINKVTQAYDVLICESAVCYRLKHPKCINLFHFTNRGYLDYGAIAPRTITNYLKYLVASFLEKWESRGKINIVVSEFTRSILEKHGILVHRVIPNAVDTETFRPVATEEAKKDVMYAGSFLYRGKGFDVLEKIARRGVAIDCVTDHPVGVFEGLSYIGPLNHELMADAYNRYRILLYPSRFENCAMVPLEAMACGLPVVISNVGAAPEIKRAIPEFVVDGHDDSAADEYVRRISLILSRYDEFSSKARQYVLDHHSMKRFRHDWLELVEGIAHKI
jgi:glycosyltransferase involved in cell wall biosynthesis